MSSSIHFPDFTSSDLTRIEILHDLVYQNRRNDNHIAFFLLYIYKCPYIYMHIHIYMYVYTYVRSCRMYIIKSSRRFRRSVESRLGIVTQRDPVAILFGAYEAFLGHRGSFAAFRRPLSFSTPFKEKQTDQNYPSLLLKLFQRSLNWPVYSFSTSLYIRQPWLRKLWAALG